VSKRPTSKAVTCVRLIRDTPPSLYALPTDGRKYKEQQQKRRALAMQLATFADGDGTRIHPAAASLMKALGWQRDTLFRYLDDLGRLGFLGKEGRSKMRGTRQRFLNLDAIQRKLESEIGETKSTKLAEQDSEVGKPESEIEKLQSEVGEQESEIAPHTTDTRTVTQTDTQHTDTTNGDECVGVLLKRFVKSEKGEVPRITRTEKKQLVEKAVQHGRDIFLRACEIWLAQHPWNSKTTNPFYQLLQGFDGYVASAEHKAKENARREKDKALHEKSYEIARKQHEEVWAVPDEKPEPDADAFLAH